MKKLHALRMLLVAALMITALPMHAQAQSQKSPNLTFKQRAQKRFNENVTRFKRCLNRECTKGELAKAGKELIAAVGALIVVSGITYFVATRNKQTPQVTPATTTPPASIADLKGTMITAGDKVKIEKRSDDHYRGATRAFTYTIKSIDPDDNTAELIDPFGKMETGGEVTFSYPAANLIKQ